MREDESQQSGYQLKLKDFNIRGTFIRSDITYSNLWDKEGYEVSFESEFLTPGMKWAGGIDFADLEQIRMIDVNDTIPTEDDSLRIPYQVNFQDFWVGRSYIINDPQRPDKLYFIYQVLQGGFYRTSLCGCRFQLFFS